MNNIEQILSPFLHITILKVDTNGKILKNILNTNSNLHISKFKNIYDIFSEEENFRLSMVLESLEDICKKYMQLSKKTGLEELVDIKVHNHNNEKYIYIQSFESNREKEIMNDRNMVKLINLSERDPLTKVLNRGGFGEKIRELVKRSDAQKRLGVIFIDIDNLKKINDTHGHKIGDKAILNVIDILVSTVRARDIVARLGGDEFVIVTEEITGSKSTAYGLAERLQRKISQDTGRSYSSTISAGVHVFESGDISKNVKDIQKFTNDWNKELEKADKAVYQSKQNGKNKVSVSENFLKYYKL